MPGSLEYQRKWRAANPDKCRGYAKRWRATNLAGVERQHKARYDRRMAFVEWLKELPCTDCGNCFPPECMDFDHKSGVDKVQCVGLIMGFERMQEELVKCELVCSNCHRTRTRKRKRAAKENR